MSVRPLWPLLKLVAAAAALLLLIDVALVRSGAYFGWIEPDSTAGSVVGATLAIPHYYDAARKNILVLGNSQIGEGFSGSLADAASERADLHFINGSVAGTTPRVWNYLLRSVDPHADRFAAIALMIDYNLDERFDDLTDYPLDTGYAVPLLRIADLLDYPATFSDPAQRLRARRAILLPLQALHDDVRALLAAPRMRYHEIVRNRPQWLEAVGVYPGREQVLPELAIDPGSGQPVDWGAHESDFKPLLEEYFRRLRQHADPALQARNLDYQRQWLERIAERYRAHGVPVIVFVVPRGPWRATLSAPPVANAAIAELAASGRVQPLPGDAFTELEQPRYFFDTLHMNRAGRARFSQLFARAVAPLVH